MSTMPGFQLRRGPLRLAPGHWRVDPAHSQASFVGRLLGRPIRGRLPLTGRVLIAEPIEDSTAWLSASTSAASTASPVLDRLLTGPGFLDAARFPEISFRSELLAWVPAGWRAVGRLQIKNIEHELASQFELQLGDVRPDGSPQLRLVGSPHIIAAGSWVIDSHWITSQRIPALGRRIDMTCSLSLRPEM